VAATGTGRRPVRPVPWGPGAAMVLTRAREAMAADQLRPPARSWICGSRSCGLPRVATADTRADRVPATEEIRARLLLRIMVDRATFPATVGQATAARAGLRATVGQATAVRAGLRATGVAALRVAADIIQHRVGVDITPVAVAADTPAVAAAIPAAEDTAEAITKKLRDSTSLREAAT
jgi:hypothetical protein